MAGAGNNVHRPLRPDFLQGLHIPFSAWIIFTDENGHGNFYGFDFGLGYGELREGFRASGRDSKSLALEFIPNAIQWRASVQPTHAAQYRSSDAVRMRHSQFHGNHATHRITGHASRADI